MMQLFTSRKTQFSFDFTSQEGVKPRFEGKKYLASGYWIDVEVYDYSATSKEDNCNPDPNYNFADCVDKKIHNDLMPQWNCVAPWLSSESHCSSVPFEKVYTKPNDMYDWFWFKYAEPFFYFQENWAQKDCQKPCILQKIKVNARESLPRGKGMSHISIEFNPQVVKYTKIPNYNIFNFLVDIG